mgnify:FL=1
MPEVEKFMGVSADDIEKIMGVAKADIEKVIGVEIPAGIAYQGDRFVCFAGGTDSADAINSIDYRSSSDGDTSDFGDLQSALAHGGAGGGGGRGVHGSGRILSSWSTGSNEISYITISTTGNASDFGDMSVARSEGPTAGTNGTRLIWAGGYNSGNSDVMDYVTIASTGDAQDFGNLSAARQLGNGAGSLTRFLHSGGAGHDVIDYVAFASTGDASDFGDLQEWTRNNSQGVCTESRIVNSAGGTASGGYTDRVDYVNPASTGDASDFLNLVVSMAYTSGNYSNGTRGEIWGGESTGYVGAGIIDNAQKFTIASPGSETGDAGDLSFARKTFCGLSGD